MAIRSLDALPFNSLSIVRTLGPFSSAALFRHIAIATRRSAYYANMENDFKISVRA